MSDKSDRKRGKMETRASLAIRGEVAYLCHRQALEVEKLMDANADAKSIAAAADILLTLCRAKSAVEEK